MNRLTYGPGFVKAPSMWTMALTNSWVIYKAVCMSNISHGAYIPKVCEELTGSLNCATESLTFEIIARSSTTSFATRKLKKR